VMLGIFSAVIYFVPTKRITQVGASCSVPTKPFSSMAYW
jgi:hypothetical protein